MTLAECRQMKKGTFIVWSEGNGWYTHGKYLGLVEVTSYGKMTFDDIKTFELKGGRKKTMAEVECEGKIDYISPRRIVARVIKC